MTWAGTGTLTNDSVSDVSFALINPINEKLKISHYTPSGVADYSRTTGNVIDTITFDTWGHITNITETGTGDLLWAVKTADFNAEHGKGYFVDTLNQSADVIVTLPVSPNNGDTVVIDDFLKNAATWNIVIQANGGTNLLDVEGVPLQDIIIDISSTRTIITYVDDGASYGWRIKVY